MRPSDVLVDTPTRKRCAAHVLATARAMARSRCGSAIQRLRICISRVGGGPRGPEQTLGIVGGRVAWSLVTCCTPPWDRNRQSCPRPMLELLGLRPLVATTRDHFEAASSRTSTDHPCPSGSPWLSFLLVRGVPPMPRTGFLEALSTWQQPAASGSHDPHAALPRVMSQGPSPWWTRRISRDRLAAGQLRHGDLKTGLALHDVAARR